MGRLQTAQKFYGNCIGREFDAADLTDTVSVFEILSGPIHVINFGLWVSTAIPAGANTLKFQHTPIGGVAADMCGATDTASAAANQLYLVDGVAGTALVASTAVGCVLGGQSFHMNGVYSIILSPGSIKAVWSSGPPATGAIQIFMEYRPLSQFTRVQLA